MKKSDDNAPLVITEEHWRQTPMSLAKYYGRIRLNDYEYWIVDKFGRDLFECSDIANKEGRSMAIEPGEPCDLCRRDFMKTYRKLGRDRVLELLREGKSKKEIDEIAKEINNKKKKV